MIYTVQQLEAKTGLSSANFGEWKRFCAKLREEGYRPVVIKIDGKCARVWTNEPHPQLANYDDEKLRAAVSKL